MVQGRGLRPLAFPLGSCHRPPDGEFAALTYGDLRTLVSTFATGFRTRGIEPVPVEWTPEKDLLTPSTKKKRGATRDRFEDRGDRLYGRRD